MNIPTSPRASPVMQLDHFPEEILEQILAPCVSAPLELAQRPSWHYSTTTSGYRATLHNRLAPLLVSKSFHRIGTPLFLETIHVISPTQLHRLLSTLLLRHSSLSQYIKNLIFTGVWAEGGELLRLCGDSLKFLQVNLDVTPGLGTNPALLLHSTIRDLDAEEFCDGLQYVSGLTHLVVSKLNNVYLTHFKPKYVLAEISRALALWNNLESVNIGFRLSDDITTNNSGSPSHIQQFDPHLFPVKALSHSLSTVPKLKTFFTLLPSVWSETILRISTNPSLERIVLSDSSHIFSSNTSSSSYLFEQTRPQDRQWSGKDLYASPVGACIQPTSSLYEPATGILWTGLFFSQARKHPRLSELIRAGTCIMRTRAHTLGPVIPSSPGLCSSFPPDNHGQRRSSGPQR
ncbi:hypothetical protein BJ165DRAFT_188860 [Panaeolus papilionaceus]|nr:hypothetical protein BJ165DRAFT_188860 [Panaeolus papilionaceus]